MNTKLKGLTDGTEAEFQIVSTWGAHGVTEKGAVYWPFAVDSRGEGWFVTHLPSGCLAHPGRLLSRRRALLLVKQYRASGIDWGFTSPNSVKFRVVKDDVRKIAERYVRKMAERYL